MKKILFLVAILATMMVSCTPKQASNTNTESDTTQVVDSCLGDTSVVIFTDSAE